MLGYLRGNPFRCMRDVHPFGERQADFEEFEDDPHRPRIILFKF